MPWNKNDIGWAGWVETLVPSAARTTTGNSGIIAGYGPVTTMRVQLDVSAASGVSPTLNVLIEDTLDGTTFNTIGTFAQRTAVGREVINITTTFAERIRVTWTLGGTTPSFTFSVIAHAEAALHG